MVAVTAATWVLAVAFQPYQPPMSLLVGIAMLVTVFPAGAVWLNTSSIVAARTHARLLGRPDFSDWVRLTVFWTVFVAYAWGIWIAAGVILWLVDMIT